MRCGFILRFRFENSTFIITVLLYNTVMYEIDASIGYVLGYYNSGEADRRYRILTRDFGLIYAHATSVRKEKSKLKHFLQKLNLVELETVQSRKGYQITGGRLINNTAEQLAGPDFDDNGGFDALGALERIGDLIARLSQNPETDSQLFDIFEHIINQLQTCRGLASTEVVELWGMARVLIDFGYFDPAFSSDISQEIFKKPELESVEVQLLLSQKRELERYIKQCVTETML